MLSNLIFNNPIAGYSIMQGAGTTGLTLTGTDGSSPTAITVLSGTHLVGAPILLEGNLVVSSSGSVELSGELSDSGLAKALTLDGDGELILSGTGSYTGGTFVDSGTLILTSNTAIANGTSLTVGDATAFAPMTPDLSASSRSVAPVPEPSTLALIRAAICGASVYRRLRSRRKKK